MLVCLCLVLQFEGMGVCESERSGIKNCTCTSREINAGMYSGRVLSYQTTGAFWSRAI